MINSANVEILIIGNEILTGDIQDTNTNWLCKMVHGRGGTVARATVLPDDLDMIAGAVQEAVQRKPDILFTSGGLGPTSDDLTLKAVAAGTGREVALHAEALAMVKKQYDHFFAQGILSQGGLTPAREKMACLPQGSKPLFNAAGTAPGVFLQVDRTAIISVPGVPSEQKVIINQTLKQFLDKVFGEGEAFSRCVAVKCNDESLLEPALYRIVEEYPEIYTKSLATTLGEFPELDIIMTITGIEKKKKLLNHAFEELCCDIKELGFAIRVKEAN